MISHPARGKEDEDEERENTTHETRPPPSTDPMNSCTQHRRTGPMTLYDRRLACGTHKDMQARSRGRLSPNFLCLVLLPQHEEPTTERHPRALIHISSMHALLYPQ